MDRCGEERERAEYRKTDVSGGSGIQAAGADYPRLAHQAKEAVEGDGTKIYYKHQGRLFRISEHNRFTNLLEADDGLSGSGFSPLDVTVDAFFADINNLLE